MKPQLGKIEKRWVFTGRKRDSTKDRNRERN